MTSSARRREKLLELWDDDEEVVQAIKEKLPKSEQDEIDSLNAQFEAQAVLTYVGSYEDFFQAECIGCDRKFATSYARVNTCSIRCLKKAVESLGFTWDPTRTWEDRFRPKDWNPTPQRYPKESGLSYEKRLLAWKDRLRRYKPVPLVVPSCVVEMLDKEGVVPFDKVKPNPLLAETG